MSPTSSAGPSVPPSVRIILEGRPFRHLCPEADLRDAMDDGEFWEHVFNGHEPEQSYEWDQDVETSIGGICETCGSGGACGYDTDGRPWIHCSEDE